MRLISQDGTKDVPYDKITIILIDECVDLELGRNKAIIYVCGDGSSYTVGEYNSIEEAKEILKRVRRSYINKELYFQFP